MAFKDKLRSLIEEKGGRTPENLSRIAGLAREIVPDFTPKYLARLLLGHPARPEDYQALAVALGVPPHSLIDDPESMEQENLRKVRKFVSDRMGRPDLEEEFIEYLCANVKFRSPNLTPDDLYSSFNEFLEIIHEDEEELT